MAENSQDVCRRILISNVDDSFSKDLLVNFLEHHDEDLEVVDIETYDGWRDRLVVVLESPVAVSHIQDICRKNPLKGKTLSAEIFCDHTSEILSMEAVFTGVGVSDDHFINFLEYQCQGVEVTKVFRQTKKGAAQVCFGKPVDLAILKQKLNGFCLEGQKLEVLLPDERGAVLVSNPHPGTKTNCFEFYFKNTRRSGGEGVLNIARDEEHNLFVIVYFKNKEVAQKVASREHFLEDHRLEVSLFDLDLDILPGSEGVHRDVNLPLCAIPQSPDSSQDDKAVDVKLTEQFKTMRLDKKEEEKKLKVEKTVENICPLYVNILDAFSDQVEAQYGIKISGEDTSLKIEGWQTDVDRMVGSVMMLHEQKRLSHYLKEIGDKFNGWEEIFVDIENKIAKGNYNLLVQPPPHGNLRITLSKAEANEVHDEDMKSLSFDDFLEMHVGQKIVSIKTKAEKDLLSNKDWTEFLETEMEEQYGKKVEIYFNEASRQITLLGSVELLNKAVNLVENHLKDTADEEIIPLNSKQAQFLAKCCSQQLETLQFGQGMETTHIKIENNVCEIKGCRVGVQRAAKKLKDIINQLRCRRAIFTHPNLASLQQTSILNDTIEQVSKEHNCIITGMPDSRIKNTEADNDEWGQWNVTVINSFNLSWGQKHIHITEGEPQCLKVDVAVICHNGEKQSSYLKTPKPQLTQTFTIGTGARPKEFRSPDGEHRPMTQYGDYPPRTSENKAFYEAQNEPAGMHRGINVTASGALPCKALIYVDLSRYFSSAATFDEALKALMTDILSECHHHHFTSLALPVFGETVQRICHATSAIAMCCCNALDSDLNSSGDSVANTRPRKKPCLEDVFLCSRRVACLNALTFALEDQQGPSLFTLPPAPRTFDFLSCCPQTNLQQTAQHCTITVTKGDIARTKADVLIVPLDIDTDLDLSKSSITKSLMSGGDDVQYTAQHGTGRFFQESIKDRNEKLAEEWVVEGRAGSLWAKCIFYVHIPPWGPGVRKILTERVHKCLRKATEKQYKTVAVTALGVGKLAYPPEFSAKTCVAAVAGFVASGRTSVENVNFVIFRSDDVTYRAFSSEQNEWQKRQRTVMPGGFYLSPLEYPHHTQTGSSYSFVVQNSSSSSRGRGRGRGSNGRKGEGVGRGYPDTGSQSIHPHGSPALRNATFKINSVKLSVKQGNILHEKCDVLVNSINDELDFNINKSGVAKAFKNHCGEALMEICKRKGVKKKMRNNGLVLTEAPGLYKCKGILHLDLAKFQDKNKDTLKKCLIHLRDQKIRSVAFPAIGTGEGRTNSPEKFAELMVDAIKEFKNPKTLEDVRLVLGGRHFEQTLVHLQTMFAASAKVKASTGGRHQGPPTPLPEPPQQPPHSFSPPEWESVCPKGYSLDPARRDAVSLFFFSDCEENQQAAVEDIAKSIFNILGPVRHEQRRLRDGDWESHGGGRGGKESPGITDKGFGFFGQIFWPY